MMAGTISIVTADLSSGQGVLALEFLVLVVIWSQLLPIVVYFIMGKKSAGLPEFHEYLADAQLAHRQCHYPEVNW